MVLGSLLVIIWDPKSSFRTSHFEEVSEHAISKVQHDFYAKRLRDPKSRHKGEEHFLMEFRLPAGAKRQGKFPHSSRGGSREGPRRVRPGRTHGVVCSQGVDTVGGTRI